MKSRNIEKIKIKDYIWLIRDKDFYAFLHKSTIPFSSFVTQLPNQCIKKGRKKELWEIKITGVEKKRYLVKIYQNKKIKDKLKDLLQGAQALREFQIALEVAKRNIPTFIPAAAGIKKKYFLVEESHLVMEKVEGCQDLAKYLLKNGNKIEQDEKRLISFKLGRLIHNLYKHGIYQVDLALNNFLIKHLPEGEIQLYLSDFEKVKLLKVISKAKRFEGLARLNRLGREISLTQRLRFLKTFLHHKSCKKNSFQSTVLDLQFLTLKKLKKDANRRRMTNVYTDCYYRTYCHKDLYGYYHEGYSLDDLINIVEEWDISNKEMDFEILYQGIPTRMRVKRYLSPQGAQIWSYTFILSLGLIPVILPHAFFRKVGGAEFIFIKQEKNFITLSNFASTHIKNGISKLSRLLSSCHKLGTFSGRIDENTFKFYTQGDLIEPFISSTENFSFVKKVTPAARKKDLESLIALFASQPETTGIEYLIWYSYPNKKIFYD